MRDDPSSSGGRPATRWPSCPARSRAQSTSSTRSCVQGSDDVRGGRRGARIAPTTPLDPARDTISFCNTGHWAATNWFAMSEVLGQGNVKLYAGSMVDWTQAPDALPMDNVPNRFEQLVIDWKLWMDRTFN